MTDFASKKLKKRGFEQSYWEQIILLVELDLQQEEGNLPNKNDPLFEGKLEARAKKLAGLFDLEKSQCQDDSPIVKDLHDGLKKLYEELGEIDNKAKTTGLQDKLDATKKEIADIKSTPSYQRHEAYAQNPTLLKAVTAPSS
ncbi:hypothetical protein [Candidatus Bandiella numerosa]|uniref:hypothetical protein n=1 Tax=Candidatus Bandiella numerosa TaxID=2570586 RepID=UPI001F1AAE30|nr:hypothetical protein [Candidatus Bandiella numerosa]